MRSQENGDWVVKGHLGGEANGEARTKNDPEAHVREKVRSTLERGWQHSCGRFAVPGGIEGTISELCTRHRSLKLQQLYTQTTPAEVEDLLREAMEQTFSNSSDETWSEQDR